MPLDKIQTGSVRKKVLFIFLIFALAFILAYIISNAAFKDMLVRVNKMTSPNDKIVLVNHISQEIMLLDRAQREEVVNYTNLNLNTFRERYQRLSRSLDSLKLQFAGNSVQISRVDSIQNLIRVRDDQYSAYLDARKNLDDNQVVKEEIEALGQMLETDPVAGTGINETSAVGSAAETEQEDPEKRKGIFSWLFGNKKKGNKETIQSEINVPPTFDDPTDRDSANKELQPAILDNAIKRINEGQTRSINELMFRDQKLLESGSVLVNQVLDILKSVEYEALRQADVDSLHARNAVRQSVNNIVLIFVLFLLVIAVMIYFILADIRKSNTYRVALEEAKEIAEYHAVAKQRFLSNMSHELRTPLQSIVGFAEQLKNRNPDDSMVNTIQQCSEHLLYIVNEVLDFNRIDSGRIFIKEQPLNLAETIQGVVQTVQPLAVEKNLALDYRIDLEGHHWVLADAFRFRQILFNLLSNAIKFTIEGKVILDVTGRTYASSSADAKDKTLHLEISVRDTGIGISQRDTARIFEHFEQVENASHTPQQGSGLGLSIVKAIVETMGGEIRVQSEQSKGSVFTVTFPVKIYHSPVVKKRSHEQVRIDSLESPENNTGEVWLIDDDRLIRDLCQTIFEERKIRHKIFSCPDDLLNEPYRPEVASILMDIRMPKMSGFALNKRLRKKIDPKATKIIAFTAQALPEEQSIILAKGFDGILLKPFREMDLLHVLGISNHNKVNEERTVSSHKKTEDPSGEDGLRESTRSFETARRNPAILEILRRETAADIAQLRAYFHDRDTKGMSFIFHRLAGRISQFGGARLSISLRKKEIDTRADEYPTSEEMDAIIDEIENLLKTL